MLFLGSSQPHIHALRPTVLPLKHNTRRLIYFSSPRLQCSPRSTSSSENNDTASPPQQPTPSKDTSVSTSPSPLSPHTDTHSQSPSHNSRNTEETSSWWQKLLPSSNKNTAKPPLKPQLVLRVVVNIIVFFLLIRFMPVPSRMHSPVATPEGVVLRVAYSDFLKAVRHNEVSRVVVNSDGGVISYALRQSSEIFKNAPKGLDSAKFSFETVRPVDFPMPYETLMSNNVPFSAMEKKGGFFGGILVRKGVVF